MIEKFCQRVYVIWKIAFFKKESFRIVCNLSMTPTFMVLYSHLLCYPEQCLLKKACFFFDGKF